MIEQYSTDELMHWGTPGQHKYIAKIGEGDKARYFYTQEQINAYKNAMSGKVNQAKTNMQNKATQAIQKAGTKAVMGAAKYAVTHPQTAVKVAKTGIKAVNTAQNASAKIDNVKASVKSKLKNPITSVRTYTVAKRSDGSAKHLSGGTFRDIKTSNTPVKLSDAARRKVDVGSIKTAAKEYKQAFSAADEKEAAKKAYSEAYSNDGSSKSGSYRKMKDDLALRNDMHTLYSRNVRNKEYTDTSYIKNGKVRTETAAEKRKAEQRELARVHDKLSGINASFDRYENAKKLSTRINNVKKVYKKRHSK